MPAFQQTAFRVSFMPESCSVKTPYDEYNEDSESWMSPIYDCFICSDTILADDTAVYHEGCVDGGHHFCPRCWQDRLESQLLPSCAACGMQLLDTSELRLRAQEADAASWGRMIEELHDRSTRRPWARHFHVAMDPCDMAAIFNVNPSQRLTEAIWLKVLNAFWLQHEMRNYTDLHDTWTPKQLLEGHGVRLNESSRYNVWRCHALVGVKLFRIM